ncbi:hypothetical protein ACLF3G_26720 [Falsiroseomonas sp. HC035]|uniref:hypothetical protein n=1 Tax=Falsiroseomonas sp. HC035 TaxID=3390999 RepID=UPI003D314AC4
MLPAYSNIQAGWSLARRVSRLKVAAAAAQEGVMLIVVLCSRVETGAPTRQEAPIYVCNGLLGLVPSSILLLALHKGWRQK